MIILHLIDSLMLIKVHTFKKNQHRFIRFNIQYSNFSFYFKNVSLNILNY